MDSEERELQERAKTCDGSDEYASPRARLTPEGQNMFSPVTRRMPKAELRDAARSACPIGATTGRHFPLPASIGPKSSKVATQGWRYRNLHNLMIPGSFGHTGNREGSP